MNNDDNKDVVDGVVENTADNDNTDTSVTPQNDTETAVTYSADEYTAAVEKAKTEATAEVYKVLGIKQGDTKTVNLLKSIIEAQNKQNIRKDTATANAENERRIAVAEAKAEVMIAGINKAYIDDAVTLILAKGDTTDIKTSITELKTKFPSWFEVSEETQGTGKTISQKKNEQSNSSGIGARLAAKRTALNGKRASVWK